MIRTEYTGNSWKFAFVAYTPEDAVSPMPLIIQLHGAGERGDDLALVDVHGFSHLLKEKDFPCIFVMPQCPKDTFWAARVESLISFIEQLKQTFSVDPDRVYLTGLSMGGYGTWFTAMARPDLFAAIAPMCGGGMAWNAHVLTMPVWAFHGVDDPSVSVTQSDEMVERMRRHGLSVKYTRMDGVTHNVWQYGYNEQLLQWLLSHKRGEFNNMDTLRKYSESFKLKFEKFIIGCDALEELGLWDKEKNGEMEAFYSADMVSVIIRLTAVDGKISPQEVSYINDVFGFAYTAEELQTIYADCKDAIDSVFTDGIENGFSYMKRISEKLACAYKELVWLICDIVIESDGVIAAPELEMAKKLKALGA